MSSIRRAVLITVGERYTNLLLNFVLIASTSRLLTPREVGVSAIGVTFIAFAESLRDLPSPYLIQQQDLSREDIWTAFTIMLLVTIAVSLALVSGSSWIAAMYHDDRLINYIEVLAFGLLLGPLERPLMALMRRDMNFVGYASVTIGGVLVNVVATIFLAWFGLGYMSFAWGILISNVAVVLLALRARPEPTIYRLYLGNWRRASLFSIYTSASDVLVTASALLPNLALGWFQTLDMVGVYNRAVMVSQLPDKIVLNGLKPVVMPAIARLTREGNCPKQTYLTALSYLAVLQWPIMILIAFVAEAAVHILLGSHWVKTVPLVQVMALAALFNVPNILTYSTLVSIGALGSYLRFNIVARLIASLIVLSTAYFGVFWLVASLLVTTPFQSYLAVRTVQESVPISWSEFFKSLRASTIVALCCAAGPFVMMALANWHIHFDAARLILVCSLWLGGWVIGVIIARHPICQELEFGRDFIKTTAVDRLPNIFRFSFWPQARREMK